VKYQTETGGVGGLLKDMAKSNIGKDPRLIRAFGLELRRGASRRDIAKSQLASGRTDED
jgi:hypothetical protein